jgi:hypothetical protein
MSDNLVLPAMDEWSDGLPLMNAGLLKSAHEILRHVFRFPAAARDEL